MELSLPNKLTVFRIFLIPIFVLSFYVPAFGLNNYLVTLIFVVASITDYLDGYLARRLKQTTEFGAFLDPVADKLIVSIALVMLVSLHPGPILAIPAAIIIGRELTVSALREWMANVGDKTKVAVSIIGKLKTMAQMIAIGFLLLQTPIGEFPTMMTGYTLLYFAAILTLWSMLMYLQAAWPSLKSKNKDETTS